MDTEKGTADGLDSHFLPRIVMHSLLFGLTTTFVPLVLEIVAALFADQTRVWTNLKENWVFNLLVLLSIFLAGAYVGSIRFSLSKLSASGVGTKQCGRQRLAEALSHVRSSSRAEGTESAAYLLNPCRAAVSLIASMGLVRLQSGKATPASPAAESFIASVIAHLKDGNPSFIGDWSAGTHEPESKRLIKLIQTIEEYRIASTPKTNASPARTVRAAIALIRADVGGIARFLTIRSDTWNPAGAWTPVMGAEEPGDKSLPNTVTREICEEMKLRPEDIAYVRELRTVTDKRISKRLGIFTDYTYAIFAVQLQQASPSVQVFFKENPIVSIDYSTAVRNHEFTWLKWEDLLASEHLGSEMPTVVEALRSLQPSLVPQTVSLGMTFAVE